MSDAPDLSEPSADRSEPSLERSKLRPVEVRGQRYCAVCHQEGLHEPNHPHHPNSPYCEYHYKRARNLAKKVWRDRQAERQEVVDRAGVAGSATYVDRTGYVVLTPQGADRLRSDLVVWQETVDGAIEALGHATESPAGWSMVRRVVRDLASLNPNLSEWSNQLAADE